MVNQYLKRLFSRAIGEGDVRSKSQCHQSEPDQERDEQSRPFPIGETPRPPQPHVFRELIDNARQRGMARCG